MKSIPNAAVSPVAPWQGGKRLLAKTLCPLIEAIPHTCYAEPFTGMGGIFFRRQTRSRSEVINDISVDVVNLFRILQRHFPEFTSMIRWRLSSRAEFERLAALDPDTLTDLERAARFLYLQRLSFGGKVRGQSFGVDPLSASGFNTTRLLPQLEEVHDRLASVTIERLDWSAFIKRYDRTETLFYLDPPYWGCEDDYGKELFAREDFTAMADQLANIKGGFVLSLNDLPPVRKVFAAFTQAQVGTSYSMSSTKNKKVNELIITNRARYLSKAGLKALKRR